MFQTSEYNTWYNLPMHMTGSTYPTSPGTAMSLLLLRLSFYVHGLLLKLLTSVYLQGPAQGPVPLRSLSQPPGPEAVLPLCPFMQFYIIVGVKL